jgi:outer membrane protein
MRFLCLIITVISCSLVSTASFASGKPVNLVDVYLQAQHSDPTFQEAQANWQAQQENVPQSIAGLLPTLLATASNTSNQQTSMDNQTHRFNNKDMALTLTQPLLDLSKWANLQKAHAVVRQAAAQYAWAKQNLMQRVASAYFDVLQAQDLIRFTTAREKSTAKQLTQANEKYHVGLVTITTVYQARADHDKILAELISANNELNNAKEALRNLTGQHYDQLAPLQANIIFPSPQPTNIDAWVGMATQHNFALLAANADAQIQQANVRENMAGHLPTVSMVGSINENKGTFFTLQPYDNKVRRVALQANIPLFQGGLVTSKVRQARQLRQAANDRVQKALRNAEFDTRKNYNSVMTQISKIAADKRTIVSNQSSVESTENAYQLGTQTIIDVLTTQRDLFDAQAILAKDQYDFIKAMLALKLATGSLAMTDLEKVNTWLEPTTKAKAPMPSIKAINKA